ncbi:MAG: radical SAM protein [Deltaproteobacteria bacterium]|nr:radical SAM protein [Deltaproteobacteria bacterium]
MIELLRRLGCYPRFCVWELTLACEMRCLHCGSFAGSPRKDELSWDELASVADQLADLRCEKVTLGGGEPTMHPRWDDLGRRLSARGVRVNLISNGWGWSPEHLARARDAGLTNVAFSLDGLEDAHDAVRRPGSFRRVIAAIDGCAAARFPVSAVTHVNRRNAEQLRDLADLLASRRVSSWQVQLGIPSGSLRDNRDLVIQPEDMLRLVPLVADLRTSLRGRMEVCPADNIGYFGRYEKALRDRGAEISFWIGCRAGMQVIGIESDGGVKGCLSLPSARHGADRFSAGNLRHRSLVDIWNDPETFAWNREFGTDQLGGFCAACRYGDVCRGGCAWTAWSHTSDRFDNPYCFYRQAVGHGRRDLLDEPPTDAELAAVPR